MTIIETRQLTKIYPGASRIPLVRGKSPSVTAVRNLDLTVEEGEVFGFLGPNGAGKSTTINLLLDYVKPTSGSASVMGLDTQEGTLEIRDRVGVLPERLTLWPRLTARKHLRLVADAKDVPARPERLLERVELDDAVDRRVGEFSTGMRQRLGLAMALVGDPDLLILDEPTAGLDPNGVRRLREIVRMEVDRGATVFFSSHVLDQVEAVSDRVGILRDGELVAVDTVEGLRDEVDGTVELTVQVADLRGSVAEAARRVEGVVDVTETGTDLVATCSSESATIEVLDAIREAGATVEQFDSESLDLETLFANYVNGASSPDERARDRGDQERGEVKR